MTVEQWNGIHPAMTVRQRKIAFILLPSKHDKTLLNVRVAVPNFAFVDFPIQFPPLLNHLPLSPSLPPLASHPILPPCPALTKYVRIKSRRLALADSSPGCDEAVG